MTLALFDSQRNQHPTKAECKYDTVNTNTSSMIGPPLSSGGFVILTYGWILMRLIEEQTILAET